MRRAEGLCFVFDSCTRGAGLLYLVTTEVALGFVLEEVDRWSRSYSGLIGSAATLVFTAALRMSGTRRTGGRVLTTLLVVAERIVTDSRDDIK